MKNYKRIVPVLLVGIFAFSAYNTFHNRLGLKHEYNAYVSEARKLAKDDIIVDAALNYGKAREIDNNIDINNEIAMMYYDAGDYFTALDWAEYMIETFPYEDEGYVMSIEANFKNKDITECLENIEVARKKKIKNERIDKIKSQISKMYTLDDYYDDVTSFHNGIACVKDGENWQYINTKGSGLMLSGQYSGVYNDELLPVMNSKKEAYYVDVEGNKKKTVAKIKNIDELGMTSDGLYTIRTDNQWFIYNFDGKKIGGPYKEISNISDGMVSVKDQYNDYYLINLYAKNNNKVKYEEILMDDNKIITGNERAFVKENSSYYMIDFNNKKIGKAYQEVHGFIENDSYAAVCVDDKWGFIDKDGEFAIKPQYDEARSFSNGYAAVKSKGKWGFINTSGKWMIEPTFDEVKDFCKQSTFVKLDNKWRLLTTYKVTD